MERDLFALDNARDLLKKELVETFIVTDSFNRLLAPKNQIIIGSRGSGKTALLKMLSHDHLSIFDHPLAQKVINEKTYIGIHISTKTKFSGGLRNKEWQNEQENEKHFQWQMNVASCTALLDTLKSCLFRYIKDEDERTNSEIEIIKKIREYWFPEAKKIYTIDEMGQMLEDVVIFRQRENLELKIKGSTSSNTVGLSFDLDLFDPLFSAIKVISKRMNFPEATSWFICIDEIEMLDEFHHRILNSYLRSKQNNIYFKFTTLPYCHYTLETNLSVPLDVRHDVHYIYIDQDPSFFYKAKEYESNALKLFQKRAKFSKPEYSQFGFKQLFGKSLLLDNTRISYSGFDSSKKASFTTEEVIELMRPNPHLNRFLLYSSDTTKKKGIELLKNKKTKEFGDQFGRKMKSILFLKDYEEKHKGKQNYDLYSGAKAVVNIGDCNPRKLIKIFNEMLQKMDIRGGISVNKRVSVPIIPYTVQSLVLATVADQELNRYKIEKNFGPGLYDFIYTVGKYMHNSIHESLVNTEQVSSIEINNSNENIHWKVVERAVQKGLLYPNINGNNPDDMPYLEGVFHLAFILSPKFKLLPRKGDARNIVTMIGNTQLKLNFDA